MGFSLGTCFFHYNNLGIIPCEAIYEVPIVGLFVVPGGRISAP